jgi:hypothetical protein
MPSVNELLQEISTNIFDIKNNATIAGYGSIGIDAPVVIGTVASTPQLIDGFDVELISTPRGVTQDLLTNSLSLSVKGVWTLYIKVSLAFDELNSGREISLRMFNLDTGLPATTLFNYFVGRNTGGVNLNVSLPFEVSASAVNQRWQIQVLSQTDTFTNCSNIGSTYSLTNSSPITELT